MHTQNTFVLTYNQESAHALDDCAMFFRMRSYRLRKMPSVSVVEAPDILTVERELYYCSIFSLR